MKRNKPPVYTEEQIAQLSNNFTDDEKLTYKELCALVHFWRDEADRHWNRYQNEMGDMAVKLMGMSVEILKSTTNQQDAETHHEHM